MLLQDRAIVVPNVMQNREGITTDYRFSFLGNCLAKDGGSIVGVGTRVSKTRAAHAELAPT